MGTRGASALRALMALPVLRGLPVFRGLRALIAPRAPRAQLVLLARIAVAALLACPGVARAFTYGDTLTTIWRPLPNLPAIHVPSETLTVWATAPSNASGWGATLVRGTLSYPLPAGALAYDATYQRWNLEFALPAAAPDVLYDLVLSRAGAPVDTARHAVRLLTARRSAWYFLQVSDTHLVTHLYYYEEGAETDTSEMADFQAVINDANIINPEFVIHTGDLINEGELEEFLDKYYWSRSQQKMLELDVPLYLASGNHDIGGWDATPPPAGTARRNWWRYFGWPYLDNPPPGVSEHSQNFWFDYGPLRVIGLEAYNNSGGYDDFEPGTYGTDSFTQEQLDWLDAVIAATPAGKKKVAFYHYDFLDQVNDNLVALGLDGALWGHWHSVPEGNLSARPFSLGVQSVCDAKRTYRLVRVAADGSLTPRPMLTAGSTGQNLRLTYAPANDGTNAIVTGTVVNTLNEGFEHALLRFKMPEPGVYQASAGTIVRQYSEGGFRRVEVNLPVPAQTTIGTTVSPAQGTGVDPGPSAASAQVRLDQPSPNPARDRTVFTFSIPREGAATLEVFDVAGARRASIGGRYPAGRSAISWDARDDDARRLPPGLYVARLSFEGASSSAKLIILP
jgi:hypothetical protein